MINPHCCRLGGWVKFWTQKNYHQIVEKYSKDDRLIFCLGLTPISNLISLTPGYQLLLTIQLTSMSFRYIAVFSMSKCSISLEGKQDMHLPYPPCVLLAGPAKRQDARVVPCRIWMCKCWVLQKFAGMQYWVGYIFDYLCIYDYMIVIVWLYALECNWM